MLTGLAIVAAGSAGLAGLATVATLRRLRRRRWERHITKALRQVSARRRVLDFLAWEQQFADFDADGIAALYDPPEVAR